MDAATEAAQAQQARAERAERRSEDSRRDRLKAEDARDRAVAARAQLEEALRTRQAERGAVPPAEVPRSGATASAPSATVADQDRS